MLFAKASFLFSLVLFVGVDATVLGNLPRGIIEDIRKIINGTLEFIGDCNPPEPSEVKFLLYTRSNPLEPKIINASNLFEIDPSKKTIITISGWLSGLGAMGIPEVRDAYLQRYDANLITLDWTEFSVKIYTTSYCQAPQIAQVAARFLCLLSEALNIPMDTVHIVGHSLGAQIAGFVGQNTKSVCGKSIGRITGLDPAGPLYQSRLQTKRLDASDANFVDIMHTNQPFFGYWGNIGHVDFYPNCGTFQPNCLTLDPDNLLRSSLKDALCSHIRAVYYFAESITSPEFNAKSCTQCPYPCMADSSEASVISMGEDCPAHPPHRSYTLSTNGSPPYAKG